MSDKTEIVEYASGSREWYINGKLHREDGPAVEHASGTREWYRNGKLHREDGPAYEHANGSREWYRNGKQLSFAEFLAQADSKHVPAVLHNEAMREAGVA